MINNEVLITGAVGLVSSITSGWVSYFFTRRKYNSEVDLNLIEKMQKSLDFYMKLSEDNQRILQETLAKLAEAEKRNDTLEEEIRDLRQQMFTIMTQICTELSCGMRKAYVEKKNKKNKD